MQNVYPCIYKREIDVLLMTKQTLESKSNILNTSSVMNIILIVNAFVWYFFIANILDDAALGFNSSVVTFQIWGVHLAAIAISALAGAYLSNRVNKQVKFITAWMILGVLSSAIASILDVTYLPNVLAISILLGFSLGIGMPSCMGYFTSTVRVENRGRIGGVIMLSSGLSMIALGIATQGSTLSQNIVLITWRAIGLLFFLLLQGYVVKPTKSEPVAFRSFISLRSFLLYFIPWVMFSLITYLTIPIQSNYLGTAEIESLTMWDNIITGVFAIVAGFLIDIVGRKRMSIVGFSLLGTAYAVLGLFYQSNFSWYFFTIMDGIAWGIFYIIFIVVIWGDISQGKSSDKIYALGVLPFFISNFIRMTLGDGLSDLVPTAAIFSFIAFFLFLAVLPLVYAPETLPEKHMKDRELKNYIEKAQKAAQRELEKNQKTAKAKSQIRAKENSAEYKRAKQLAEKYY